eukprot:IDg6462t1
MICPHWRKIIVGIHTDVVMHGHAGVLLLAAHTNLRVSPSTTEFITEKRSQFLLVCSTCWLNMYEVTTGFDAHRLAIVAYIEEKSPAYVGSATQQISNRVNFALSLASVGSFLENQGLFVTTRLVELPDDSRNVCLLSLAATILSLCTTLVMRLLSSRSSNKSRTTTEQF